MEDNLNLSSEEMVQRIAEKIAAITKDPIDCLALIDILEKTAYIIALQNGKEEKEAEELSNKARQSIKESFYDLFI